MTGFKICDQKGFHITFENGWTVSVQFGRGNYCDNYDHPGYEGAVPQSSDAEIAAWNAKNAWFEFQGGNTVEGNATPARVLSFMAEVAAK